MMFGAVSAASLDALARALGQGRLATPYDAGALTRYVGPHASTVAAELERLRALGASPALLVEIVGLARRTAPAEPPSLVWSGPGDEQSTTRDTGVVVRELFAQAEQRVLVVGFAVYQGREIFQVLAERMDADPALDVVMCLDVSRPRLDTSAASAIVRRFADRLFGREWPGQRRPRVYYDPRSLALDGPTRASLHAKCVVIDGRRALVTSANFTAAAQARNIEAGLLVDDPQVAASLHERFNHLITCGELSRLPGS